MKNLLTKIMALVLAVTGVMAIPAGVYADTNQPGKNYIGAGSSDGVNDTNQDESSLMDTIKVIINVVLGLVGIIAVVMMIVGGINFITSQGDPGKTKKARDTILYGVVGLVVALLAFAIVNFVLGAVFE